MTDVSSLLVSSGLILAGSKCYEVVELPHTHLSLCEILFFYFSYLCFFHVNPCWSRTLEAHQREICANCNSENLHRLDDFLSPIELSSLYENQPFMFFLCAKAGLCYVFGSGLPCGAEADSATELSGAPENAGETSDRPTVHCMNKFSTYHLYLRNSSSFMSADKVEASGNVCFKSNDNNIQLTVSFPEQPE